MKPKPEGSEVETRRGAIATGLALALLLAGYGCASIRSRPGPRILTGDVKGEVLDGGTACHYGSLTVKGACRIVSYVDRLEAAPDWDVQEPRCGQTVQVCGRAMECSCEKQLNPLPCGPKYGTESPHLAPGHDSQAEAARILNDPQHDTYRVPGKSGLLVESLADGGTKRCDYRMGGPGIAGCGVMWGEREGAAVADVWADVPYHESIELCGHPIRCECPDERSPDSGTP